jgi:hypothetical protein
MVFPHLRPLRSNAAHPQRWSAFGDLKIRDDCFSQVIHAENLSDFAEDLAVSLGLEIPDSAKDNCPAVFSSEQNS